MAKTAEFEGKTKLAVSDIKRRLNGSLKNVTFSQMESGPMDDELPALAVFVESQAGTFRWQWTYGPGLAMVALVVEDEGDSRKLRLTALGASAGERFSDSWQNRGRSFGQVMSASRRTPNLKSSTKLAEAILAQL